MAIEIVDFPIKNGDFHWFSIVMLVYQRVTRILDSEYTIFGWTSTRSLKLDVKTLTHHLLAAVGGCGWVLAVFLWDRTGFVKMA